MSRNNCLVGLIGRDIGASRSPCMHQCEGEAQGLRLTYSLFDFTVMGLETEDLPRVLDAAQLLGFAGVNITHPFKQQVLSCLDELSDHAEKIGAVNTVASRNGKRIGYNTDAPGFATGFQAGLPDAGLTDVVQFGAGGGGAATAHALLSLGVEQLTLLDVRPKCAALLAVQLNALYGAGRARTASDAEVALANADGIINATPVGMQQHPGTPFSTKLLKKKHWVADIVYFPLETALLKAAHHKGCRTLDGSGMAVSQAAASFEIFTGRPASMERMRQAFLLAPAGTHSEIP